MARGRLIVIDGSDGVGKATQTKLLVERLRRKGKWVETLDFPQYKANFFGAFIGECLSGKQGDFLKVDPYIVSVLYAADRWESKAKIERWLREGAIVVLDRYVSANQMHQGGKIKGAKARAAFLKWLDRMEHKIFGLPRPDLIMYLNVPFKLSLKLIKKRRGKKLLPEKNPRHLAETLESALRLIARNSKWKRIDCARRDHVLPRGEIHEKIYECVRKTIGL